jgi:ABC-type transporter MlaC component
MIKKSITLFLTLFFICYSTYSLSINPDDLVSPRGAMSDLRRSIGDVMSVLDDSKLKSPERREERINEIIKTMEKGFDLNTIAKETLGSMNWVNLKRDEKDEFKRLFSTLIVNKYLQEFDRQSDVRVIYLRGSAVKNKANVKTDIAYQDISTPITFVLRITSKGWKIIDALRGRTSVLRNYSERFAEILTEGSYQNLKEHLEKELETAAK